MLISISKLYVFKIHFKEVINMGKKGDKKSSDKGSKDKTEKKNQKGNTVK